MSSNIDQYPIALYVALFLVFAAVAIGLVYIFKRGSRDLPEASQDIVSSVIRFRYLFISVGLAWVGSILFIMVLVNRPAPQVILAGDRFSLDLMSAAGELKKAADEVANLANNSVEKLDTNLKTLSDVLEKLQKGGVTVKPPVVVSPPVVVPPIPDGLENKLDALIKKLGEKPLVSTTTPVASIAPVASISIDTETFLFIIFAFSTVVFLILSYRDYQQVGTGENGASEGQSTWSLIRRVTYKNIVGTLISGTLMTSLIKVDEVSFIKSLGVNLSNLVLFQSNYQDFPKFSETARFTFVIPNPKEKGPKIISNNMTCPERNKSILANDRIEVSEVKREYKVKDGEFASELTLTEFGSGLIVITKNEMLKIKSFVEKLEVKPATALFFIGTHSIANYNEQEGKPRHQDDIDKNSELAQARALAVLNAVNNELIKQNSMMPPISIATYAGPTHGATEEGKRADRSVKICALY